MSRFFGMRLLAWWVCLAVGTPATASFAQTSPNGTLHGHVRDAHGGALQAVTIELNPLAGPDGSPGRVTTTDAAGFFRMIDVPPGEYGLVAKLPGFATYVRSPIAVRAALALAVNISMQVSDVAETIEVRADSPMIEATRATHAVNIDASFLARQPMSSSRHWSDFLAITPGLTLQSQNAGGPDGYQLRGSDFASHAIQIDGADMASAQQNATTYVHFSTEVIQDVQVKTGASDASAPLGVGAVISVATKSGTNRFSGVGAASYQPERWSDGNNPAGPSARVTAGVADAAAGGPLMRDRLWIFGAIRYQRLAAAVSRTAAQVATLSALKASAPTSESIAHGTFAFVKGTLQPSPRHRVELSYHSDPAYSVTVGPLDAESFVKFRFGGARNVASQISSVWSSSLATRAAVSHNNKAVQIAAGSERPSRIVHAGVFASAGQTLGTGTIAVLDNGNSGQSFDQPFHKTTISADLTLYRQGWLGSHEIQAGAYLQPRNHEEVAQTFASDGFTREEVVLRVPGDPGAGVIPFHRERFNVATHLSARSDHRDYAVYVQDAWRPFPRLTANAGVRVDMIRRIDRIFDIVTQRRVEVGPRFGVNGLLSAEGRDVIRASWSRIADVLPINGASGGVRTPGKHDLYDRDLDGTFETVLLTPPVTAELTNNRIDAGRPQPRVDEATVGYTRQFAGNTTVDVTFVHREYRNRSALVEINGRYEGSRFVGYADERFNELYRLTNNVWNWHVYSGLEAQAARRSGPVQFLGGYTWSRRRLAGTWQPNDPAGIIQPGAFENSKGIGGVRAPTTQPIDANSLSGTHQTDNSGWRDHALRAGAVYHAPLGIVAGVTYSYQSGPYSGPIVTRLVSPDDRFGPPTVTLSSGRVVPNPLATSIRIVHPTRSDGQLQLPSLQIWNVRIGRDVRVSSGSLELAVDVLNVANAGATQRFLPGANQQFSPNYGLGTMTQLPRAIRLSARCQF